MEQVRVFSSGNSSSAGDLEKDINAWLREQGSITITARFQSSAKYTTVITIFYKLPTETPYR